MIVKEKVDAKIEEAIDKLKDEYLETQQTVSELRKRGNDTNIAEMMLIGIPAKITMAKNTHDFKDIQIVKKDLSDIKKEISDITVGSDFDRLNALIQEAFEHLRKDEKKQAQENYFEVMKIYKILTSNLKKTVYSACLELQKRLT